MLSKLEYKELVKFRSAPIQNPDGPTPMVQHLCDHGYIAVTENAVLPDLIIRAIAWTITTTGEVALSEYEEHYRRKIRERLFQIFLVLLGAALALLSERLILLLN